MSASPLPVGSRRGLGELNRPTPGASPEFWPQDWRTFQGSDAYGWGATTANLLIRHLMGFKESRTTRGWVAVLAPALPGWLRQPGRRYTLRRVLYRGLTFDLSYTVAEAGLLEAELDLGEASRACQVRELGPGGRAVYASRRPAARHRFRLRTGEAYRLELH